MDLKDSQQTHVGPQVDPRRVLLWTSDEPLTDPAELLRDPQLTYNEPPTDPQQPLTDPLTNDVESRKKNPFNKSSPLDLQL